LSVAASATTALDKQQRGNNHVIDNQSFDNRIPDNPSPDFILSFLLQVIDGRDLTPYLQAKNRSSSNSDE
jgi:hypothetical protein